MTPSPLQTPERIEELDVLRGFALLGVFIVHFVGSAFYELPLDEDQSDLWSGQWYHATALFISDLFFQNKANTLFATLFGMGFWVMLERLSARSADFNEIYLRRLAVLFLLGMLNWFLIFPGDVLHEYALIGFALFAFRRVSAKTMLLLGLTLALFGRPLAAHLLDGLDLSFEGFDDIQVAAFEQGEYLTWVGMMASSMFQRDFLYAGLLGWGLYIFGRFLLGAWVMREGWIQRLRDIPGTPKAAVWLLAVGLATELGSLLIFMEIIPGSEMMDATLHMIGAPVTAVGYALALIALFQTERWRSVVSWFAPVGRMALTCYVAHGLVFTMIYMPFGLDLLGVIAPALSLLIALTLYVALTLASHSWLRRFRYGPLEYLWRWATYGSAPLFRVPQV